MRRWPDIRDRRFELHPINHDPRHGEIPVAIVQRAVVVQHLRRDDPTIGLLIPWIIRPRVSG